MIINSVPDNIKKHVRERANKKLAPKEVQLFFRPLIDDSGNVIDWVLVGDNVCTDAQCDQMYNACSSCRSTNTRNADKEIAKEKLNRKASNSGIIVAKPKLTLPKG